MATSVTLPALGESVTEGTVTRWLKQPGEQVQADEPLLEVSTDKVDTEIPSPVTGTLLEIKVGEDETVEVGAELAIIGTDGEGSTASAPAADQSQRVATASEVAAEVPPSAASESATAAEPQASPPPSDPAQAEGETAQVDDTSAEPAPAEPAPGGSGTPVTLPALGESVTEGTVTRWLKQVGDTVEADEALLEVSTDKVDTEIPSPIAGTVLEIKVSEDETVEVGAELAIIGSGDGAAPAASTPSAPTPATAPDAAATAEPATAEPAAAEPAAAEPAIAAPAPTPAAAPAPPTAPGAAPSSGDSATYVTPLVRKLASQHGVDLSAVAGTGVGGRIRKQDVLAAAESTKTAQPAPPATPATAAPAAAPSPTTAPAPSQLRGTSEPLSRLRKVIAARVHEAIQNTAQLTTVIEVDVTAIARLRDRVKASFEQREGVKLSFLPFFAKATLEALKEHPKINASIDVDAGTVTYHDTENLVIAVDTDRGLMVPVIHNAGDLNIAGLTKRIADLAERTRNSKLKPDEVAGGTFTLTNTGSRGALFDTPIFFEPQVAILGTGAVVKRPVVVNSEFGETIAIRHMIYLALSYDHRLIDGADAARFLGTIKQRLEGGQFEGDLGI